MNVERIFHQPMLSSFRCSLSMKMKHFKRFWSKHFKLKALSMFAGTGQNIKCSFILSSRNFTSRQIRSYTQLQIPSDKIFPYCQTQIASQLRNIVFFGSQLFLWRQNLPPPFQTMTEKLLHRWDIGFLFCKVFLFSFDTESK